MLEEIDKFREEINVEEIDRKALRFIREEASVGHYKNVRLRELYVEKNNYGQYKLRCSFVTEDNKWCRYTIDLNDVDKAVCFLNSFGVCDTICFDGARELGEKAELLFSVAKSAFVFEIYYYNEIIILGKKLKC